MVDADNGLDELGKEIRKIISDNRKFLERVMDEEFDEEEEPAETDEEDAGTLVEL
jgi:hypothetical protein